MAKVEAVSPFCRVKPPCVELAVTALVATLAEVLPMGEYFAVLLMAVPEVTPVFTWTSIQAEPVVTVAGLLLGGKTQEMAEPAMVPV